MTAYEYIRILIGSKPEPHRGASWKRLIPNNCCKGAPFCTRITHCLNLYFKKDKKKTKTVVLSMPRGASSTLYLCRLHHKNLKNPSKAPRWLMHLCHTPQVIDIPSKCCYRAPMSCVWQIHVAAVLSFVPSLPAAVKAEGLKKEWDHMINILYFHVCFSQPHSPALFFLVSFTSLFYHCQSFTSLSLHYCSLPSFSLNLLPLCTTATSPSPSSALWHLFASWGLRGQLLLSDLSCFKCSHYNVVT